MLAASSVAEVVRGERSAVRWKPSTYNGVMLLELRLKQAQHRCGGDGRGGLHVGPYHRCMLLINERGTGKTTGKQLTQTTGSN